jgi:hypothetical protein
MFSIGQLQGLILPVATAFLLNAYGISAFGGQTRGKTELRLSSLLATASERYAGPLSNRMLVDGQEWKAYADFLSKRGFAKIQASLMSAMGDSDQFGIFIFRDSGDFKFIGSETPFVGKPYPVKLKSFAATDDPRIALIPIRIEDNPRNMKDDMPDPAMKENLNALIESGYKPVPIVLTDLLANGQIATFHLVTNSTTGKMLWVKTPGADDQPVQAIGHQGNEKLIVGDIDGIYLGPSQGASAKVEKYIQQMGASKDYTGEYASIHMAFATNVNAAFAARFGSRQCAEKSSSSPETSADKICNIVQHSFTHSAPKEFGAYKFPMTALWRAGNRFYIQVFDSDGEEKPMGYSYWNFLCDRIKENYEIVVNNCAFVDVSINKYGQSRPAACSWSQLIPPVADPVLASRIAICPTLELR